MKKCVGYLRVSSKGQAQEDKDGFHRQRETIQDYADKNDMEIIDWYHEIWTGKDEDRPEFLRMVEDLLSNGCRYIIIECLDRFGRRSVASENLLRLLISKEISLISAMSSQNITDDYKNDEDPMRRAFIQFVNISMELDRRLTVRKLRKARETIRATKGKCEGQKLYGNHLDPEVAEREKEAIEIMLDIYNLSHNFCEVARQLEIRNIRPRKGKRWTPTSVKRIIEREMNHDSI